MRIFEVDCTLSDSLEEMQFVAVSRYVILTCVYGIVNALAVR